jgi:hypothetical protein
VRVGRNLIGLYAGVDDGNEVVLAALSRECGAVECFVFTSALC